MRAIKPSGLEYARVSTLYWLLALCVNLRESSRVARGVSNELGTTGGGGGGGRGESGAPSLRSLYYLYTTTFNRTYYEFCSSFYGE